MKLTKKQKESLKVITRDFKTNSIKKICVSPFGVPDKSRTTQKIVMKDIRFCSVFDHDDLMLYRDFGCGIVGYGIPFLPKKEVPLKGMVEILFSGDRFRTILGRHVTGSDLLIFRNGKIYVEESSIREA